MIPTQNFKKVLILTSILCILTHTIAQTFDFNCLTEGTSSGVGCDEDLHTMDEQGPFYIKVYVHVINDGNGDGGQTDADIAEVFRILDVAFTPHNIFFWNCSIDPINEDVWYDFDDDSDVEFLANILDDGYEHSDGIDMFLFPDKPYPIAVGGGRAVDVPSTAFYVAGNFQFPDYSSEVKSMILAHEMGHCLGLLHTHHYTGSNNDRPITAKELVV